MGTKKGGGHCGELFALAGIYGVFGAGGGGRRSVTGFDFDEGERIAVIADEVDFAVAIRESEIAGDDGVAAAAEKPVGVGFTAKAGPAGTIFWRFAGDAGGEAAASTEVDEGEDESVEKR